jgi:hypothetical protein
MSKNSDLRNRTQNSRTIWRRTQQGNSLELFEGRVELANGEVGICAGAESIDMANAAAPFSGYLIVLFSDGSVSNQTFQGKAAQSESETRVSGTGNWELTGGTGRFAGVEGGGSFTWSMDGDNYHSDYGF